MSSGTPTNAVTGTAGAVAATGTSAAAHGGSSGPSSEMMSTTITSLDDLRNKSPKVYNAMMEGIAMNIVNENKDANDKFKEKWKEMLRDFDR